MAKVHVHNQSKVRRYIYTYSTRYCTCTASILAGYIYLFHGDFLLAVHDIAKNIVTSHS